MAKDNILKVGSNEMELVDFRIFKQEGNGVVYEGIYGVNVAKVREIIKIPNLTELPGVPLDLREKHYWRRLWRRCFYLNIASHM